MRVTIVCLAAALGAGTVLTYVIKQTRRLRVLQATLENAQTELGVLARERRSERAGRTKAERALRSLTLEHQALKAALAKVAVEPAAAEAGSSTPAASTSTTAQLSSRPATNSSPDPCQGRVAYPLRPIGLLRSCFSGRNGTPRQPLLVKNARSELELRPELSPDFFEGLQQFSHCWVLYIFHENTDLQRLWTPGDRGLRAKIAVPRLDGQRLGALATRSPHRPCPVGLSVGRVLGVRGRRLLLGGLDVVDGSPVLDIKPYLPFCDAVVSATAPDWAVRERVGGDEPLAVAAVELGPGAEHAIACAWRAAPRRPPLYESEDAFIALVKDVLSRDIRSVTQRLLVPKRHLRGGSTALDVGAAGPLVQGATTAAVPVACGSEEGGIVSGASRYLEDNSGAAGTTANVRTDNGNGSNINASAEQIRDSPGAESAPPAEGYWRVVLDGIEVSYDIVQGPGQGARPVVVVRGALAKRTGTREPRSQVEEVVESAA